MKVSQIVNSVHNSVRIRDKQGMEMYEKNWAKSHLCKEWKDAEPSIAKMYIQGHGQGSVTIQIRTSEVNRISVFCDYHVMDKSQLIPYNFFLAFGDFVNNW